MATAPHEVISDEAHRLALLAELEARRLARRRFVRQRYTDENRDQINAYSREWRRRKSNPRQRDFLWVATDKPPTRRIRRWRAEGTQQPRLTAAEYDTALAAQDGKCAICRIDEIGGEKRFCADHDHKTGKVRQLLCHHCNFALGHAKDSPQILRRAAEYLEAHQ